MLSDGDGNPRGIFDNNGNFLVGTTSAVSFRGSFYTGGGNGLRVSASENTPGNGIPLYVGSTTANNYAVCLGVSDTNNYTYLMNFKEGTGASGQFRFYSYTTLSGYFNTSGNWYKGDNTTTWSTTSDERVKENIISLDSGLSVISALRPVEFDYKRNQKHDVGFIAQEYETVLPAQVYEDTAIEDEQQYVENGKVKVISQNLVPYLVKAIQELKTELDELKSQIGK